ncbi:MAG: 1-acyl-sn-glycerol-3-phosphate acyltransferase [Oscillospiraceae bacterium]|nr:1-acyl-sn-glycerol-3-phosphate acyltransferase [Oscillospiraceae bacterium]
MIGDYERFDFRKKPNRQWNILRPIVWLLCFPTIWLKRIKIRKYGMKGLKAPYLLLCNHNAFLDFSVMTAATFPQRANYVVAIDGFLISEWLLRAVGCFGVRKFTSSLHLVRNMKQVIQNGDMCVLFPEARYSLCGTQSEIPLSVAKLARVLKVPIVTLLMHGNHIDSPFWNPKSRSAKHQEAEIRLLLTAEETQSLPTEEIHRRISEALTYDDYAWQKEKGILVKSKTRAEGLHKILYQCPHCGTEYKMGSAGAELFCSACGRRWLMEEDGRLRTISPEGEVTAFSHIPDWYEWQRANVRKEVDDGTYSFSAVVRVDSLPNAKRFIDLGLGTLTHDMEGFTLNVTSQGQEHTVRWKPQELIACHVEFEYKGKGDCVDLNTRDDTLYCYPQGTEFSVTKLALATEELHKSASSRDREGSA